MYYTLMKGFLFLLQKILINKDDNIKLPLSDKLTFEEKMQINSKIFYNKSTSFEKEFSRQYYYQFMMTPENIKPLRSKFTLLQHGLDNIFYSDLTKIECINIFNKLQVMYRGFCKLAFIYKFKKAKLQVSTDLFLNDLKQTDKNVMTIFDSNNKYLFTIVDLVNIFYSSLCNAPYFIPSSIPCKNPYNNIPFTKANLYNIYFFLLFNTINVPAIIHNYFMCNFNLRRFQNENKRLIHEHAIIRYVNNSPPAQLRSSIIDMIYEHNRYKKKLRIHHNFPLNKLLEIMRPYLMLYYKSKYSGLRRINRKYELLLCSKMKEFINYNPKFGQKLKPSELCLGSSADTFNDLHIKFKLPYEDLDCFNKSHLSTELDLDTSDNDTLDGNDDFDNEEAELEMSY